MLRKLVILGVFAGSSASIPVLYQSSPETFHAWLRPAAEEPATPAAPPVKLARAEPQAVQLTGRKVAIAPDARGHFTAEFKLNGRRIEGMIDTGATLVAINMTTARRAGIVLQPSDFKYEVQTANGSTRAAAATIATLQVGRIAVENVDAVVLEDRALSETLVGLSFLNKLSKYQVDGGTLVLSQ